jgi:hypothetical protein
MGWFYRRHPGFVLAALTTIISSKPGMLINAPANAVKAVVTIAIVLTALFGFGGSAHAATLPKPRPATASVDPLQKIMDDIFAKSATFKEKNLKRCWHALL